MLTKLAACQFLIHTVNIIFIDWLIGLIDWLIADVTIDRTPGNNCILGTITRAKTRTCQQLCLLNASLQVVELSSLATMQCLLFDGITLYVGRLKCQFLTVLDT